MKPNILRTFIISCILTCLPSLVYCESITDNNLDLSGEWQFGYQKDKMDETIKLPGSMLENEKGTPVSTKTQWIGSLYDSSYFYNPYMAKYRVESNIKFPFFLTPAKHYVGKAWYQKTINIPSSWKNRRVFLFLERAHIVTTAWINGELVGTQNSLTTPHEYDISKYFQVGENTILLLIDNNPKLVGVGMDSHSVTDQTQGCWNGAIGKIELRSKPQTYIEHIDVYPNTKDLTAKVQLKIIGKAKKITAKVDGIDGAVCKLNGKDTIFVIPMKGATLWNEFTPKTYKLKVSLDNGNEEEVTFGMREIEIRGKSFYVNGEKVQLRGTVENCCFPQTGYAPMDKESWIKVFQKCKSYGLNHMRFHSYCPPEAAFEAADEVGFYLQPEGPSWPNHGVSLGRGEFIDKYLMDETKLMTSAYGNHPSFALLACGNEPRGNWVKWCSDFVDYWKATDPRRVYTGASVGGGWQWQPKSQFHVKAGARGLAWDRRQPSSNDDYTPGITSFYDKATKTTFEINEPFVAHEMGQWCAFPDFNEIPQYTGLYKAKNFEIFKDLLRDNGMEKMDRKFLMSSGNLQKLCYKYEIERQMRTPDYAGFQLLSLNDYSGQGTALVGVLNVFFREKGYCTDTEFREFCSPTVILARFPKFTFENNETLSVPVEVTNYTQSDIKNALLTYSISDTEGKIFVSGTLNQKDIIQGDNTQMGNLNIKLEDSMTPQKYTLELKLNNNISNHYDFWVYPSNTQDVADFKDIYITDTLDSKAIKNLQNGGKVLITAAGKIRYGKDVQQQYLPVFWNTSWFKMRPPHTTGAYINKEHPIFNDFPTDDWTNINWWELMNKQQVMQFTEFPRDFQPIVQSIDTWFVSRKIGMLFEANVLKGKLLMTSIDINSNLDKRIVARQLRKSILEYMSSNKFKPEYTIDVQLIKDLFEKEAPILDMYTKDSPDELKPKIN